MRYTALFTIAAFSGAVIATAAPQDDVASILEALRENNPEDAEAAAAAMKVKLRRQDDLNSILAALAANNPDDAAAAKQGMSTIQRRGEAELDPTATATDPAHSKRAAPTGINDKRQDDLNSILAALEANNPDDAAAAKQAMSSTSTNAKRQDDLNSILAALAANNPDDAAAAKQAMSSASNLQRRGDDGDAPTATAVEKRAEPTANNGKRQNDVNSILAALEANNPDDAAAAKQAMSGAQKKRWVA